MSKTISKFMYRRGNLEARSCDDMLLSSGKHTRAEIVQYGSATPNCWTILSWRRDKEGFDISFVGSRPFDKAINRDDLWRLMKITQTILDFEFEETEGEQ